jgi:N-acetylmuramoyl-L-alanine amidase
VRLEIIGKLKIYGDDVTKAGRPDGLKDVVGAFLLHFRPADYSGKIDVETTAILYALIEKYA